MSVNLNDSERDEAWLLAIHPDADDDQVENFLERVAIAVHDAGMGESEAREWAERRVFGG